MADCRWACLDEGGAYVGVVAAVETLTVEAEKGWWCIWLRCRV